jgi:hypothetical protein
LLPRFVQRSNDSLKRQSLAALRYHRRRKIESERGVNADKKEHQVEEEEEEEKKEEEEEEKEAIE